MPCLSISTHHIHLVMYRLRKINFLPTDRFSNLPSLEGFPAWKYSIFPYFGLLDALPRRNSNYEIPRGVSLGISWSHTIRVDLCILCNGLDFYWTSVHGILNGASPGNIPQTPIQCQVTHINILTSKGSTKRVQGASMDIFVSQC